MSDAKNKQSGKSGKPGKPGKGAGKGAGKGTGKSTGKGKKTAAADKNPFVKRTAPPRLRQKYQAEVVPAMVNQFKYGNKMAVPRLTKISVNFGLGEALLNPKLIDSAEEQLGAITGQKPVVTRAKKSIAAFKLRQGQAIGCSVTLRSDRMFEFLDRLVNMALPRTRDFRGISPKCFDGRGNMTLGIKEQIIFPEIDYDKIEKIKGLNVCIVTTAKTDEEGRALLKNLGMPFRG